MKIYLITFDTTTIKDEQQITIRGSKLVARRRFQSVARFAANEIDAISDQFNAPGELVTITGFNRIK